MIYLASPYSHKKTGNTECLIDLANYARLEFRHPSHPQAHFRACNDSEHCPEV